MTADPIPPIWNGNYTWPTQYRICNCVGNGTGRCCMDPAPAATTTVLEWQSCAKHNFVALPSSTGGFDRPFCSACGLVKKVPTDAELTGAE